MFRIVPARIGYVNGRHGELLRALATPGCIACREGAWAEERFVAAYVHEAYTDANLLAHLVASLGFCPAHTRLVAGQSEAPHVLPSAYAHMLGGIRERWGAALASGRLAPARRRRVRARSAALFPARCPLCESRDATVTSLLRALSGALGEPEVVAGYLENGGVCLPHARLLLPWCARTGALVVTALLQTRFEALWHRDPGGAGSELPSPSAGASVAEPLVSLDTDAVVRAPLRRRLVELAGTLAARERDASILESVALRLTIDACPVCLAAGVTEARALAWLAAESARDPAALRAEGVTLCSRHLHDAAMNDAAAAHRLAALALHAARADVAPVHAHFEARRRDADDAVMVFARSNACFVCRAMTVASHREAALLDTVLRDVPTATRYRGAHGVCVRHALVQPPLTVVHVLGARLAIVAWELAEANRRSAWPERFDVPRSMGGAWMRAPALFDGHTYLGGPAVPIAAAGE